MGRLVEQDEGERPLERASFSQATGRALWGPLFGIPLHTASHTKLHSVIESWQGGVSQQGEDENGEDNPCSITLTSRRSKIHNEELYVSIIV
jgi:hypothetical protein